MTDDQWVLLIDPVWQAASAAGPDSGAASASLEDGTTVTTPPLTAVVGGWLARADGSVGRFEANPAYEPSGPGSPTDPLDATLRLAARAEADLDQVAAVLRESAFSVALDVDQEPLIAPSPDNVPCLLVVTAPAHRTRVRAAGWLPASAEDLLPLLSAREGTDLLLNPGAPGCTRLLADTVREAVTADS